MITPNGRFIGGLRSLPDPRDHRLPARAGLLAPQYPQSADMRARLPGIWDQGELGSCEAHGCGRVLSSMYSSFMPSRLAMYYKARLIEGTVDEDSGAYTRDMLKVMQAGVYSEDQWPYSISNFKEPPPSGSPTFKIGPYARISDQDELMAQAIAKIPSPFSMLLPDYFDDADIAEHSVMRSYKGERTIGGHCMCVVGYHTDFRMSEYFRASGLAEDDVEDDMALVANSWGDQWGLGGHCWIPISYILDFNVGNDIWAVYSPSAPKGSTLAPMVSGVVIEGEFIS
jgi:C1A family cysteine protease